MYKRMISLDNIPRESFFIWGPRQSGKSTWLQHLYPDAYWVNLLKSDSYAHYLHAPQRLREEIIEQRPALVIIDEIQKLPILLDEVHYLLESTPTQFGLCGSSARKVKRGHANLLGGRALRYQMFGLIYRELQNHFDLTKLLNSGYLPAIYDSTKAKLKLRAYCSDYLKEEIAAEALTRNLPAFSRFLEIAALGDTERVSFKTISRDCSISSETVRNYYQILIDTLLGYWLVAYTKRPKRRIVKGAKFYFDDVGVVNYLSKRSNIQSGNHAFGKAFENFISHEIHAHSHYSEQYYDISYWQLSTGIEVDFILGDMEYAIEAKSSENINSNHLKGLREIIKDHPNIKSRICVSQETHPRQTEDGIHIWPYTYFIDWLWESAFN